MIYLFSYTLLHVGYMYDYRSQDGVLYIHVHIGSRCTVTQVGVYTLDTSVLIQTE
jgi:hypothetical protein